MKRKKGIIWAIVGLIAIVAIILVLSNIKTTTQVILEDGLIINPEDCSKITNVANTSTVVIHQLGCTHCAKVLPILRELEQQHGSTFAYYDLAIDTERKAVLDEMNILPKGVPVVVNNCEVIVGERTKEEYEQLIFPIN